MAANAKKANLSPSALLFLSIQKDLAKALVTYNFNPDPKKGELLTYPTESLTDLSKAIKIIDGVVLHQLTMYSMGRKEFVLTTLNMTKVFITLGKNPETVEALIQYLSEEADRLIRIRHLSFSKNDIGAAEQFCYCAHLYFQVIESDKNNELLRKASEAIAKRPW